jgi:acyl-CoA synthetase (AMP-forming)/AMP-acid ligase II
MTASVPPLGEIKRVDECMDWHARTSPGAEAFVQDSTRLTYREAGHLVDAYARSLIALGVRPGDRVAVLGHSRFECLVALMAAAKVGAIYVGLNPKYTVRELVYLAEDAQPTLVFGMLPPAEQDQTLGDLRSRIPGIQGIVTREPSPNPAFISLPTFLQHGAGIGDEQLNDIRSRVSPTDPAVLVYTSGSTGFPKGALLSHHALIKNTAIEVERWWKVVPRCVNDWPINHIAWVQETSLAVMLAGGTLFFRERFNPAETVRLIERERLNSLLAVGSMLKKYVETPEFTESDLTSLERILFAVDVSTSLLETLQARTGAVLATSLGMTETVGAFTFTDDDADLGTLATTVGRPDPRFEVLIVGDEGLPVPQGAPGEIAVRSDSLFLGYLNRPEATAEVLDQDGFLHTGDVGVFREDGNLKVVGRKREMFKSGGYNVYPTEVEMAVAEHPAVAAVAVVGVADQLWGEVGLAYVAPRAGATAPHEEELRAFCKERLANYKVPKRFMIRADLPMLATGKIDKAALRKEARGGPEAGC